MLLVVGLLTALVTGDGGAAGGPEPGPGPAAAPASLPVVPLGAGCSTAELATPVRGVAVVLTAAVLGVSGYGTHPVCRVEGTIAPQIRFVLELPVDTYRQRYLQVGCGGLCGEVDSEVPQAAGCAPLTQGQFALATNDLGHVGTDGTFGADPQQRADFAYRADHDVAVVSKALIARAYRAPPAYSYFSGCSTGGREALAEVQRYPDDFDGVVAGAPALLSTELFTFYQSWVAAVTVDATGTPLLDPADLALLHSAVLADCDADDGLVDGLLGDPRGCVTDPAVLRCPAGTAAGCLDDAQVQAAQAVYAGPRTGGGQRLYPGGAQRGSELEWQGWILPEPPGATTTGAESLARPWTTFLADVPLAADGGVAFDVAAFDQVQALAGLYDAADPDLSAFRDSGGKLLVYHGWSDPAIPPTGTLAYHQAVLDTMGGPSRTDGFLRLYMVPGLAHCVDGSGPTVFDALSPVLRWVERGEAPGAVVATDPRSGDSRPVFAYPQVAEYAGEGSTRDATSFSARTPSEPVEDGVRWLGGFVPGGQLWWDGVGFTGQPPGDR